MANLEMIVWDVQHGNAIYVKTPNNKHLVFDLGIGDYSGHNQFFSPLAMLWNNFFIRHLDFVMITHPHLDHIDDIMNLTSFNPSVFARPSYLTRQDVMQNIREQDRPKFEKYFQFSEGYTTDITGTYRDTSNANNYGGVSFQFFSTPTLPKNNLNNHSIITVLQYLGGKIIIPGDNECASLNLLMEQEIFKNAIKDCDILIAPHHGRESACHAEFLKHANPSVSIISDGSVCDTSANSRYSAGSRGWTVYKRGTSIGSNRRLLTTNSDGEVYVTISPCFTGEYARYLKVETV